LKPTYYDCVARDSNKSFIVDLAKKDAMAHAEAGQSALVLDEKDSNFYEECISELKARITRSVASYTRKTIEEAAFDIEMQNGWNMPEFLANATDTTLTYFSFLNFELFGAKVFNFAPGLTKNLLHTEINVKANLIELPFKSCLFVFEDEAMIDAVYAIAKSKKTSINYNAPISVFLVMDDTKTVFPFRRLMMHIWHAKPSESHLFLKRELCLKEEWDLERSLRTDWNNLSDEASDPSGIGMGTNEDSLFYTDGLLFFRAVLNAILYVSSSEADIREALSPRAKILVAAEEVASRPKRKALLGQAARNSEFDYSQVGDSVEPIDVSWGPKTSMPGTGSGSKPAIRFVVRGHWKRQPFGPGASQRRLHWIKPYFKGPEVAALVNKPYAVK
jgi:hypothetical protein